MKLYEKSTAKYSDGSIRNIYHMEPIKGCNELKGFLLSFQDKFGDILCIIVKRYEMGNCVLFYKRYNDLYDFLEGFNLINIRKYNIYEFSCGNMHCKIDAEKDIIDIYRSVDITQSESDNYDYYKFSSGLIVRYNNDNGRCYYLDKNKWILRYSLQSMIDNAAYAYEIIENPLKDITPEVSNEYIEKNMKLSEQFKPFCTDIEIIMP